MAETVIDTLITEYGFRTDVRALRKLDANIDRIRKRLNSVSRGFTVAGGVMTGALFGVGRGMVDFDREINRLQRDTNATEDELAQMRARVIELGSSSDYTTISVTDAARALRELAKGGLTIQQAMEALPQVLNLVAATEIDVGEAATKTAKLMKGFGLEVADIPRIHDLVANAQVKTGITAAQMIDALLRVAPTARTAGLSIEDMTASLAILVDQGQISERAATSFERVLVQLSKAEVLPPAALNAFKQLGVNIKTVQDLMAQGKIIDALALLSDAGLDVATASQIFGEDGQRAALTLAAEIPRLQEFRATFDDIEGAMSRQAATMNQGLSGAWAAFISSLSAARESLGDAGLRGWLQRAATRVRELVEAFTGASEPVRKFVAIVLASGPALLAAGAGIRALSFLLGGLAPLMRWTALAVKAAKVALAGLALVAAPVSAVVAAIVAAALLLLVGWKPVSTFFIGLWQGLSEGSGRVGEAFGRLLDALGPVGKGITAVGSGIRDVFSWLFNLFGEQTDLGRGWGDAIIDGAVAVIDFLTAVIEKIKSVIEWVRNIPSAAGGFFGGLFEGAESLLSGLPGEASLAAATAGGGNQTISRSTSVNVERIDINAEGADADQISAQIGESLSEQLHNAAEDFDSDVVR